MERMDRGGVLRYAREQLASEPEYLWARHPGYLVLRHSGNKKWYAAILDVPRSKLGLSGGGPVDILNVKCGSALLGSLLETKGVLPAYHMNKANWVSVLLDGTAADADVISLLTLSYDLTKELR